MTGNFKEKSYHPEHSARYRVHLFGLPVLSKFKMADVIIDNPVFLGVPDAEIEQNDRTCTWDTNKFGGYPVSTRM